MQSASEAAQSTIISPHVRCRQSKISRCIHCRCWKIRGRWRVRQRHTWIWWRRVRKVPARHWGSGASPQRRKAEKDKTL